MASVYKAIRQDWFSDAGLKAHEGRGVMPWREHQHLDRPARRTSRFDCRLKTRLRICAVSISKGLQSRWQSVMGHAAPRHLPKHLLFGVLAYRIQADALGDLDQQTIQLLKRIGSVGSLNDVVPLMAAFDQRKRDLLPGTVLTREWNGRNHRVMRTADSLFLGGSHL